MEHQDILKQLNNQFIEEYGMTRGELSGYFDKVKNPGGWKLPIDSLCVPEDVEKIKNAIIFFTGSVPVFKKSEKGYTYHVKAVGYYAAVGA
jgi:hypothetical protein